MTLLQDSPAWLALQAHSAEFKHSDFRCMDLFESGDRFRHFSLQHEQLLLDYSKNFCSEETIRLLLDLARQCGTEQAIADMFAGAKINTTENRAALHVALRIPADTNPHPEVLACQNKMNDFVEAVHSGQWRGFDGREITDVVNIGIGGSDLGPSMVTEALTDYASGHVRLHFVSNIDPQHANSILAGLNPATTLFIIASKSFRTLETHENAGIARRWFLQHCEDEAQIAKHFVAITTNQEAAAGFGIDRDNLFPMWDWVGGRYSLWSAIGLSIALAIGMKNFQQLLAGAHAMDQHFQSAPLEKNMPVLQALLSVWYSGFFDAQSHAVVPYLHRLRQFPNYLQQLSMESLGKSVSRSGDPLAVQTGEVIWGTEGSNGQHSFFQLLHQGTGFIPVDFIVAASGHDDGDQEQHEKLLANCLSQSLALLQGRHNQEQPHRNYPGNRPSNTLLLSALTPYNLGSLLALYEHKVYIQSVLWNINAFDQWGVELGKELSDSLYRTFSDAEERQKLDSSSAGLLAKIMEWK